jgi:uncharacterized membrane protein YfcA
MDYLYIFMIMFSGALLQGITGFGSGLFAVPLLSLLLPLTLITPLLSVVNLVMAMHLCWLLRHYVNIRPWLALLAFGIVGSLLGNYILLHYNVSLLQLVMALFVLVVALLFWFGIQLNTRASAPVQALTGLLAGLGNGALTLGGPPVVLFLTSQRLDRLAFRATLSCFFLIMAATNVTSFTVQQRYHISLVNELSVLLVAVISGAWLGHHISGKLSDQLFRKISLILVMLAALVALIKAWF